MEAGHSEFEVTFVDSQGRTPAARIRSHAAKVSHNRRREQKRRALSYRSRLEPPRSLHSEHTVGSDDGWWPLIKTAGWVNSDLGSVPSSEEGNKEDNAWQTKHISASLAWQKHRQTLSRPQGLASYPYASHSQAFQFPSLRRPPLPTDVLSAGIVLSQSEAFIVSCRERVWALSTPTRQDTNKESVALPRIWREGFIVAFELLKLGEAQAAFGVLNMNLDVVLQLFRDPAPSLLLYILDVLLGVDVDLDAKLQVNLKSHLVQMAMVVLGRHHPVTEVMFTALSLASSDVELIWPFLHHVLTQFQIHFGHLKDQSTHLEIAYLQFLGANGLQREATRRFRSLPATWSDSSRHLALTHLLTSETSQILTDAVVTTLESIVAQSPQSPQTENNETFRTVEEWLWSKHCYTLCLFSAIHRASFKDSSSSDSRRSSCGSTSSSSIGSSDNQARLSPLRVSAASSAFLDFQRRLNSLQ